jgi:hypothetical protein
MKVGMPERKEELGLTSIDLPLALEFPAYSIITGNRDEDRHLPLTQFIYIIEQCNLQLTGFPLFQNITHRAKLDLVELGSLPPSFC